MADARKFSRKRREIKLNHREAVERYLQATMFRSLREQDPTARHAAVHVISELAAVISSQLLAQTQANQRALITLREDIADYATEFVSQLMAEAAKDGRSRVRRTVAATPPAESALPLADDWAGPVAGPTLIERHFGIPRSTLYRWQKRGEVVALNTRTSKKPVFPLRQFVDGRPAAGIAEVLRIFGDPRTAWRWLLAPNRDLGGSAPIDKLLKDEVSDVLGAAGMKST
nr:MbcA/ParS/Xre antitoxin family protein [Nitrosomonas nitrosa]